MLSPCCKVEMQGYRSKEYPYDSGYKCSCCGAEFSHLQISRGALDHPCEPWALCKSPKKHGILNSEL